MASPLIPIADLASLQAISPGKPSVARTTLPIFLPQAAPGQVMSARVDAVLPDGTFRVVVANQEMSMALPKYFSPGDTMDLVFLGREPRLTFALTEAAQSPASPAPVVSAAGRLVATVLPRPGEAAMAPAASGAPPLLAAAPEDGTLLSNKLLGTLVESGLFYESHQAEWVAGKRELSALLREPQARIEPRSRPAVSAAQARIQAEQGLTLPGATAAAPAAASTDSASITTGTRAELAMPPQVQTLVQQQLAALETGRLVFQLQVWPDQWMRWEIDEEAQRESGAASEEVQSYSTRLHLDLPNLGGLDATLSFSAGSVRVRLDAAKPESAALMQDQRASLRAALADAGLPAADIAVTRHGQA